MLPELRVLLADLLLASTASAGNKHTIISPKVSHAVRSRETAAIDVGGRNGASGRCGYEVGEAVGTLVLSPASSSSCLMRCPTSGSSSWPMRGSARWPPSTGSPTLRR
jgi:hypothetical protein